MGVHCRYDGGGKLDPAVERLMEDNILIPVCPELLGGLPTPRESAERRGERIVTRDGADVTRQYLRGAAETLRLAQLYGCTAAVLKERSPSCGTGRIHDGTFSGAMTDGDGTAAELLRRNGIRVVGESQIEKEFL
jgi:uncharacterized protein YbbK (DUF523 family)